MNLSNNIKLDFLVVVFARAVFEVGKMDNSDDKSVVSLDNSSYRVNRKIHSRVDKIISLLDDVMAEIYEIGGAKLYQWVKKNSVGKIDYTILSMEEDVNLEYLSLNILYLNFCDYRDGKKLFASMEKIREQESFILETLELFDKTKVGALIESSYNDADHFIKMVKNDVYRETILRELHENNLQKVG